jgi:transposase-like protein
VAALLLRLAGVSVADIAADYGVSAENIKPLWQEWVEDAGDENERELRRRLSASPAEAMAQVLETLERERGSVCQYLLDAGVSPEDIESARRRLRG